ncbi:MAG: hypothetical protein ACRDYB_17305, partial [Acidimicrobiales bacterium]
MTAASPPLTITHSQGETALGPYETDSERLPYGPSTRLASFWNRNVVAAIQAAEPIRHETADCNVYRVTQDARGRYEVVVVGTVNKQVTVTPKTAKETRFSKIDVAEAGPLLDLYMA